jgi:predicted metal-dependent hydrolase
MKSRASIRPENLTITVRKVEQDYLGAMKQSRFWHSEGATATHFLNALQATFPEGERFFIEAARDGVKQLKGRGTLGRQLEADYERFLRQEGAHSVQHARWTSALVATGYRYMKVYDAQLRALRRWLRGHFSAGTRLGMTAAAEHYTATLAHLMAHGSKTLLPGMARPFQTLMLYHAMEEVEHKAVCYDLYQALSGSYPRRVLTFLFITLELWISVLLRNRYLLRVDGLEDRAHRAGMRSFYWGKRGLFRTIWPRIRAYLRPSFHPWQTDERETMERTFGGLRRKLGIPGFA